MSARLPPPPGVPQEAREVASTERPPRPIDEALESLLGSAGRRLVSVFRAMEVADRLLREAGNPPIFMHLCIPEVLSGKHERLYAAHAAEIIARVGTGVLASEATDAELLAAMVQTSLAAPLNRDGELLYHALFRRVMGDEQADALGLQRPRERWAGQLDELLREARRKVRTGREHVAL